MNANYGQLVKIYIVGRQTFLKYIKELALYRQVK